MTLKNIFLIVLFSLVENSLQNPYVRRISRETSSIIHSRTYREPAPEIRSYDRGPQVLTDYRSVQEHHHRHNFERQPQDTLPLPRTNTFNTPSVLERREITDEFENQPHHNNERTIQSATEVYSNTEYKTDDTGMSNTESGYQYNLPPKNFNHNKPYLQQQQQPAYNAPGHNPGYQSFDNNLNRSQTNRQSMTNEISRKIPNQSELKPKEAPVYQNVPDQPKPTLQPNTNENEHLLYITTSRNTHHNVHEGDKKSENSSQNWLSKNQAQNVTDGNTDKTVNNIVNTKTNLTVTIDNRDSFNGGCPDGYKRVNGVCVIPD